MTAAARRRPFYLVLALLAAMGSGACGAHQGWLEFVEYHGDVDPSSPDLAFASTDDRAIIVERARACLAALDGVKTWGWPLAAAAIVLGSAMFVFAVRSLAGNRGARRMLVQIVIAQAALNMAQHWVLRGLFEPELALEEAKTAALARANMPELSDPEARTASAGAMVRAIYPFSLAAEALGSALIVLALTRRRTREFFDASGEALEER